MSTATLTKPAMGVRVRPDVSATAPHVSRVVSVAEYLRHDDAAERRSEYIAGEIIPMARATRPHVQIVTNCLYALQHQLLEQDCDVFSNDTRVRAGLRYYYPDAGVVCGEYIVDDGNGKTLTNPSVVIEVLSDSTASVDRGVKLRDYLRLPSLRTYLLVSQDAPLIEQYERADAHAAWQFGTQEDLTQSVELPAIGCRLALAAIYRRVSFPEITFGDNEAGATDFPQPLLPNP